MKKQEIIVIVLNNTIQFVAVMAKLMEMHVKQNAMELPVIKMELANNKP